MATTTPNFGFDIPQSTDLVKDGATAIAALGTDIDTAFVDLKGGTTGQVLSKASNTDLDFTWVAQDDSNAIQNAIVDAKGDLISATAADTPARLAVGTNGQYLIADSTTATGLKWGDVSAGAYTQLATGTLSTVQTAITTISSSYTDLYLVINNPYINTGSTSLVLRLNNRTDNTMQVTAMRTSAGTNVQDGLNSYLDPTSGDSSMGTSSTAYHFASFYIRNYSQSNTRKTIEMTYTLDGAAYSSIGYFYATDNISSLQIRTRNATATFSGGTYTLYGVK